MPKFFADPEERKAYYKKWWQSEKGVALKRSTLLRKALAEKRFPSRRSIQQYDITAEELEVIFENMKGD